MQPLGLNRGCYKGEQIDVRSVLHQAARVAEGHRWSADPIVAGPNLVLPVFRKHAAASGRSKAVYISAGMHGDEPAGPLAALELLRQDRWPDTLELWLLPCLNPSGFPRNTRENSQGVDLNRDYLSRSAPEVQAHIRWLSRQGPFDLCICLHEDWESAGAYIYELNPDGRPSLARAALHAAETVMPIESASMIDGRPTEEPGIIRPSLDPALRPQWPEALYLFQNHTRLSYTLETSSDFPLFLRVQAQVAAVNAMLERFTQS